MDEISWFRYFAGFAFVLALLGLFAYALKRWGKLLPAMQGKAGARVRVVETCFLDARHRAVLLARDGVEHLVLIGPEGQVVVESGINAKQ